MMMPARMSAVASGALLLLGVSLVNAELAYQAGAPSAAALVAAGPGMAAGPASACPAPASTLLFTQKAPTGSITPVKADLSSVILSLYNVGKTTSFFANTPDQYAGRLSTEKFTAYWKANESDWVPNAALTATGPKGNERTIILTLKEAPVYDNKTGTLTYNASVILQNTTLSDSAEALKSRDVINNMARGLEAFLVSREDNLESTTFNMTDVDLFIDNVAGCVGYDGRWVNAGGCGRTNNNNYYNNNVNVCVGYHGRWVGGVWCA